ncbi:MAG: HAD family phosphatase [Prolixibacteraceae bacterium]|jgi:putative hydrolase of the HAD superfamily|nr:HAD family phosphatase [Prolixibacteraceae bacterium]
MVKLNGIRNIIFDLGGVLLNLAPHRTMEEFRKLGHIGLVEENPWNFKYEIFYKFERGFISVDEFHSGVKEILGNGVTNEQIDYAWTAMLLDIPSIRAGILQNLKKQFRTFLFSNTNAIHVERIHADFHRQHGFEFSSLFDKDFYSNEIHVRKPDVESFLKVIRLSGVKPEETLFIDDFQENIVAARETGLQTLWLQPGMTVEEIFSDFR